MGAGETRKQIAAAAAFGAVAVTRWRFLLAVGAVVLLAGGTSAAPYSSYGSGGSGGNKYSGDSSGSPVTTGSIAPSSSSSSAFTFHLPRANDGTFDLATSLTAAGRTYGSGAASQSSFTTALTRDSDAIVYPDDIVRDSYGNIARPYEPLSDVTHEKLQQLPAGVGFHNTDVSTDKSHHYQTASSFSSSSDSSVSGTTSGGSGSSGVSYPLPSYAGGIIAAGVAPPQLDLLPPPQSSGNYNYAATADSSVASTASTSHTTYDQPAASFNEVLTGASKYPVKKPDVYVAKPSPLPSVATAPVVAYTPAPVPIAKPDVVAHDSYSGSSAGSAYTHGKFTGTFGGAPGVLGEQKVPGTAYNKPSPVATSAALPTTATSTSYNQPPAPQPTVAPINLLPPPLQTSPSSYNQPPPQQHEQQPSSSHYPAQSQAAPSNLKPPPLPSAADQQNYYSKPSVVGSSYATTGTSSSGSHNQYAGTGSSGSTTYGSHSTSSAAAPALSLADILGEQKQPGYGVIGTAADVSSGAHHHQQSSVVATSSGQYGSTTSQQAPGVHHHSIGAAAAPSDGKYTGGFGGPPGVLSPYDKNNNGSGGGGAAVPAEHPANSHGTSSSSYAGPKKRY